MLESQEVLMDRKYLIVGAAVVVVLLLVVALILVSSGYSNEGVGIGATALATAEAARRARAAAQKKLDDDEAALEESTDRLEAIRDENDETMAASDAEVDGSSLSDLVDSENRRDS